MEEMETPRLPTCDPSGEHPELLDLLRKIKKERGRPLFVIAAGPIRHKTTDVICSWRKEFRDAAKKGIDILIDSPGGSLSECYVIGRLLSRWTDDWEALIPQLAASGATLISLGSSRLVMSETAQLSPLDPQVISKRVEKFFVDERQSPLEAFQATRHLRAFALESLDLFMDFLSDQRIAPRMGMDVASKLSMSIVEPILNQIDPYDLGEFALDSKVALDYCRRVGNPTNKTKKTQRNARVKELVEDYPAHEFVIDIDEARELGFNVVEPEPAVDALFAEMCPHFRKMKYYIGMIE